MKIVNKILLITKFILLILTFVGTMYLLFNMYQKLDKNIDLNFILIIIPFIILLILFFINFSFKMSDVLDNIFYNSATTLSLLSIVYLIYRVMNDKNMLYFYKDGYNLNFTYFDEQINYIKIVLYLMIIINVILMVINYLNKKKKKIEVDV